MLVIPIFLFLLSTSEGDKVRPGSSWGDWEKCPPLKIHNVDNTKLEIRRGEILGEDVGTCIPDEMNGSTNWYGVMAGISSLIPGGGFAAGIFTILSSINFGGSYTDDLDTCIRHMISQALQTSDLQKCQGRMQQIQVSKTDFLWAIDQTLDEDTLAYAYAKIIEVTTNLLLIQNDFAQEGGEHTEERKHEKFLDFLLDSMAAEASARVLLLNAIENQNFTKIRICAQARNILHDLTTRYDETFTSDGIFSIQKILEDSPFNDWAASLEYKIDISSYPGGTIWYYGTVRDGYRNGMTCAKCSLMQSLFMKDEYCEIESNEQHIDPWEDWTGNAEVFCNHCEIWANNQKARVSKTIEDGNTSYLNMMNAVKEVEERWECSAFTTEELQDAL